MSKNEDLNSLELSYIKKFYEYLSDRIFYIPTSGITRISNITSSIIDSLIETVDSSYILAKKGRFNDSYSLMRKYYDAVILDIYINTYIKNEQNIDQLIVPLIEDWANGIKALPSFKNMTVYIKNKKALGSLEKYFFNNEKLRTIREECNNNIHHNGLRYLLINSPLVDSQMKRQLLENISKELSEIFTFHVCSLFYINGYYMMSSDYTDHMEIGMKPPENCQYWISPFIKDFFDNRLKKTHSFVFKQLKKDSYMEIE